MYVHCYKMACLFFSRSPDQVKLCVSSEETSPFSTHASSIPSLHELSDDSVPAASRLNERATFRPQLTSDTSHEKRRETSLDHHLSLDKQHTGGIKFCVADVRKRLNDHMQTPKKMFNRDPEDPSGMYVITISSLYRIPNP